MDKLQEMASFVAVVDAGSFVRAADASGLSKAAISRHVNTDAFRDPPWMHL